MSFILALPRAFILASLDMIGIFLDFYFWVLIVGAIVSWLVAFGVINTYNRFVQTIVDAIDSLTEPLLTPIRRAIPPVGGFDLSPLVLIISILIVQRYFLPLFYGLVFSLFSSAHPSPEMVGALARPIEIIVLLLDIYIWLIIIGVVLSWLIAAGAVNTRSNFISKVNTFIRRITEPFLRPIRRRLTFVRGIDMSLLGLIFMVIFVQHFLIHLIF